MLPVQSTKPLRNQLCFDFAREDERKRGSKPRVKKTQLPAKVAQPLSEDLLTADLSGLCVLLHKLAKRHVMSSSFQDYNTRVRCTKLLESLGLLSGEDCDKSAVAADQDGALVKCSKHYRQLRNQAIACLATVADLAARAPNKGTGDYQRGMRDAFQQASDIAILFLEDIQGEQNET